MHHVQTKKEIQATLQDSGLRPRKQLGQNFLIDGNLMRRLVETAQISKEDLVIEVGGGTGGLTDLLVQEAGQVVTVELDQNLQPILLDRFEDQSNFTLIAGDALEKKYRLHPELIAAIEKHNTDEGGSGTSDVNVGGVKLVANLPYQIATPLVMNLLIDYPQVKRLVFTVQAEVGERITANPNSKAYGPLSIVSQTLCNIETVTKLPPHVFWPRPTIDSVMLKMELLDPPIEDFAFEDRNEIRRFSSLVRKTFEHRRKTIRSALGYVIDDSQREKICDRIDSTRRPESFTIEEWLNIFRLIDM